MHRRVVLLLALVGCDAPARPAEPAPPRWVVPPPPTAWPLGAVTGRIGRAQAPQLVWPAGITGDLAVPLRLPTLWQVPGDGPARAVIYGLEGVLPAIELIDIDAGRVVWRDTTTCLGPIVGVTEDAIVCADASGVRGLSLDRKTAWRSEAPFVAITGERVVVGPTGEAVILDAASGDEIARIRLPPTVLPEAIVASCGDAGRELFASGIDGALVRIAEAPGGPALTWSVPVGAVDEIAACDGDTVLVKQPGSAGARLIALARATGQVVGRLDGVRGWWPARERRDALEIATADGVATFARDLGARAAVALPPLGELLAQRGDRRLVRASPRTAVVLDRAGVRAYVPLAAMGAVLGDHALVVGSWVGSQGETVRRLGLPARYRRVLRLPPRNPGVAVPAELRDLPAVVPLALGAAIPKPDTGMHSVAALALDRVDPRVLYASSLEAMPGDATRAGLAAIDLAQRAWRWQRTDGCGPGSPIALVATRAVIVCAARGPGPGAASVRATTRDGAASWERDLDTVDAMQAAGDSVLVAAADRVLVLDAATGRSRGVLASDDGAAMAATVVELADGTTLVITSERGRIVARLARAGMLPVWTLAVDGVVRALSPSADGVLVELEDGDAIRLDAATGAAVTLPGLGLGWRASGELVTGATAGGPIPGSPLPPAPSATPAPGRRRLPPRRPAASRRPPAPAADPERPRMWTPIPPPPPLGDSFQYSLFELTGGLRARNDYAITGAIVPAVVRGPTGSPLAITYGIGPREVLVLDPRSGDPLRRVALPDDAPHAGVFSTVIDGTPVAGVVLAQPLRIVLF